MNNNDELLHADIAALADGFQTVLMATSSKNGEPEISYSPRVVVDGSLYVFVSDLSVHTANLKENPRASLLFIEDESGCENLHARRRVTYKAGASLIPRNDPEWLGVMRDFEAEFGEIIEVLKSLPDFHLFRFTTDSATIVRGFADARTLECKGFA